MAIQKQDVMGMDKSRDEELVHQSLDDEDENAFEILYHRYEMSLLNFFYRRVGSWETAQDLMQETFIRVHAHLGTLRDRKKFSSWMFSIAKQLIATHIRENRRSIETAPIDEIFETYTIEPEHRSPIESIIAEEQMKIVRALAKRLPESERSAFELRLNNMTLGEIAETLDISPSATKVRLHRAKQKLVAWMKAEYPGEFDHIFRDKG
ncbi:MAG: RNA polymerase sigma factor [Candidatus Poribacteria bacterium]|nr:RNA polymerase sigma factor [Candidatus Poribacteria bacterium]